MSRKAMSQKIAVLGTGANGSCIAASLIDAGLDVVLIDQWPAHVETMRANKMAEAYLRPLVFLGDGELGLGSMGNPVRVAIAVYEWGAYLGEEGLRRGIRAKVSSYTRGLRNLL